MTETERRALKEHINILDCVQREWREVRPSSPHVSTRVRKCVDVARGCEQSECVWRRGERVCKCLWTGPCYTGLIDFLTLGYSLRM